MAAEPSREAASSSTPRLTYDVFLNFRGEDTRKSFTDHLYSALKRKCISVFRDDEKLERGRNIRPGLLTAIQESEYAVTVISENYASSTWCLDELSEIVKCKKEKGLKILPVFYKVNPSDVRKQKGSFEGAFAKHAGDNVDGKRTKMWIDALNEVCGIAGYAIGDRPESKVVDEICIKISRELSGKVSEIDTNLVGMESRVKELMTMLHISENDIRFTGICGMGGIGKTTLAEVVYNKVYSQFDVSCFISNVREESKKSGSLIPLQKKLISQILKVKEPEIKIDNASQGQGLIASMTKNKKVLIVLDDVDEEDQLDKLVRERSWFGEGSRVLVTSRDRNLLNRYAGQIYAVESLSENLALKLFNMKAFKQPYSEGKYEQFIKEILKYAGGLPLALKTFGSFLFGRKIDAWRSAIDRLKADPGSKIMNVLKISFEGLNNSQQSLFLDIACFFKGKSINTSTYKLEALGYFPKTDIPNLVEKSLITISQCNIIEMHDLLQQIGYQIAHESQKEPSKQSRLWHHEDIIHILKNNMGNHTIESMVLETYFQGCPQLNLESFSKMNHLKLLEIICPNYYHFPYSNIAWEGDPLEFHLSNTLRVIEWWRYPLEYLPTSFQLDNLVVLSLPLSKVKLLWDGQKSLKKLKYVDLSNSSSLMKTPNFSGVLNLEVLILSYCTSLFEIHSSIGLLRQLKVLKLNGCGSLKRLPNEMDLPSLQSFNLSGCSRLEAFPNIIAPSLQSLYLSVCSRLEAFPNITTLSLQSLNLFGCSRLEAFPNITAPSLQSLDLSRCSRLEAFPNITALSLQSLDLSGCSRLEAFPKITAPSLQSLYLSGCSRLEAFPNIMAPSLQSLNLFGCSRLEAFPNITTPFLQCLYLFGCSRLEAFPNITAPSLQSLDLSGCSRLEAFPNITAPSLQNLDLSGCSRLEAFPNIRAPSLQRLYLSGCSRLEVFPNITAPSLESLNLSGCSRLEAFPNITAPSLQRLNLFGCSRLEAFPNITAPSLQSLNLSGCSRLEAFANITAPSLQSLDLSGCSRLKVFPNMMVPSLKFLNLNKCLRLAKFQDDWNNMSEGMERLVYFYAVETSIRQLPSCIISAKNLHAFEFERSFLDPSGLGVLNLSSLRELCLLLEASFHELGKFHLDIEDCYLVRSRELFHNEVDVGPSTEIRLIDDCSVLAVYFASDGKLYQTVHMDPRTSIFSFKRRSCSHAMAWGPTLGSEVPGWFTHKSIGSCGSIRSVVNVDVDDDLRERECEWNYKWEGYALFMVYEVLEPDNNQTSKRHKLDEHGNSNSRTFDGNDPNSPTFHCKLQVSEEGPRFPIIFSVPEGPRFGLNGVWILIKAEIFQELRKRSDRWSHIGASIVTRDSNVEVKECGGRLVRTSDLAEFYEVLKCISPHNLDWNRGLQEFSDLIFPRDTCMRWNIPGLN